MNIQEIFGNKIINALKNEYIKDNVIKSKALTQLSVFKKFPYFSEVFHTYFLDSQFREVLYCIFNNISEIPKCNNSKCNNYTKLRNYKVGFQQCCCKECVAEMQKYSELHKEKCKEGVLKRFNNIRNNNYTETLNCNYSKKNYYIFNNYCKHGNITIYRPIANRIYQYNNGTFCIQCNKNLFNNYNPSDKEIIQFQNIFSSFYQKYSHCMKYDWWIKYFPKYFKILIVYFEKYVEQYTEQIDLLEVYYQFLHNLKGRPYCCMCNNVVEFSHSGNIYRKFCNKHLYGFNKSAQEIELGKFIDTLNIRVIKNTQNIIQGELDFYFPEKNFAIEYNGCWWHSDKFKIKNYHYNKWKQCQDKGIDLIYIWEDDLLNQSEKVYSLIKEKLGLYNYLIDAKDCIIKEVDYLDAKTFITIYHLLRYKVNKIRLGLYYNNELVSIMTFRNSRVNKEDIEIIRYCTKNCYYIVDGYKILFEYFKNNYNYKSVICWINGDIDNGDICKQLGMDYIGYKENYTYMYKGKRYRNIINKNYVKCYGVGLLKYQYMK